MKNAFLVFLLVSVCASTLSAQTFTDSNLPIILINTDNSGSIPDEPKVSATMKIIYNGVGNRNYLSDQNNAASLNYNGKIGIETRGSTSQFFDKKPFSLTTLLADKTTNNNVSLLGMPKDNDWVLNALVYDSSSIRDYLSYNLSRAIGQYAPRTQYCEVVVNDQYAGLYMLQEKIKVGDNRVDITKMTTSDINTPEITGGYITKADKVAGQDVSSWKMSSYSNSNGVDFIHEYPKASVITTEQGKYIKDLFMKLASTASNNSVTDGYPSVIDIPSFIDFMLINELSANVDAYQFSTFFHKDRNGKLRAGPLWDLNLTYSNDLKFWYLDRSKSYTWQFDNGDNTGAKFWKDLFDNSTFKCYFSKRWNELTQEDQPLNLTNINATIDAIVSTISEGNERNNTLWKINKPNEISRIKNYLAERITWMNSNIGSYSACTNVSVPPLVITKINYHPATSSKFPESSDQEFIEITNNSSNSINIAGCYFSGTGFVYNFPNRTLPPNAVLQLANERSTFFQLYDYSPFGEFSRNLSNSSQKLTLADAFGNIIDQVEYSTKAPWPDADGNGSYLKLTDINSDNNVGTNWVTSTDAPLTNIITGIVESTDNNVRLFPSPVETFVYVQANTNIRTITIFDARGGVVESLNCNSTSEKIQMEHFRSGLYVFKIETEGKPFVVKVNKK